MGDLGGRSLLLLCSLAGLVMVVGSLFLLWKGRIYLDEEGNSVTEVELPLGIRFKSQFPVLIMFLFGAFLLAFPVTYEPKLCRNPDEHNKVCPDLVFHNKKPLEMVTLKGKVASDTDVQVFAIVDSQSAKAGQDISLSVPFLEDRRYLVRYTDAISGRLLTHEDFRLELGKNPHPLSGVRPQLGRGGEPVSIIPRQRVEPSSAVSEFKTQ